MENSQLNFALQRGSFREINISSNQSSKTKANYESVLLTDIDIYLQQVFRNQNITTLNSQIIIINKKMLGPVTEKTANHCILL